MSSEPETRETLANEILARTLAEARIGGFAIAAPTEGLSSADAYSVQHRVRELLGSRQIGWKVGSTSKEAQARLGTDEPGSGALLERYCYEDGAEIPVSPAHDVFIEVEFAVRFGRTLEPRTEPYTYDDLRTAVSGVMPALEIVGSRFESGLSGAGQALVNAEVVQTSLSQRGRRYCLRPNLTLPVLPANSMSTGYVEPKATVPGHCAIRSMYWYGLPTIFVNAAKRCRPGVWSVLERALGSLRWRLVMYLKAASLASAAFQ